MQIVNIFINDRVSEQVAKDLRLLGVELIVLRCAGYNNVNVPSCLEQQISVAQAPRYTMSD